MKSKGKLALLIAIPASVMAAIFGPFLVGNYYPGVVFRDDSEINFMYAGSVPRKVMLTYVSNIKRGDIVRVVYADGEIYDYEASSQCSYVSSTSCNLVNPVKVSSPDAPAKPGVIARRIAYMKAVNSCRSINSVTYSVQTGYWHSEFIVYNSDTFGTTARWVSTGERTITQVIDPFDRANCK